LKQHAWVSSPLQVRPSLMFNCGIRVQKSSGRDLGPQRGKGGRMKELRINF